MIDPYTGKKIVSPLDFITIESGTTISLNGFPFRLIGDAIVEGLESNYRLALSQSERSVSNLIQAASPDK